MKTQPKMRLVRKEFPKVRGYVKHGHQYYQVDLRRKGYQGTTRRNFTDRTEALTFAADVGQKVSANGMLSIATVADEKRTAALIEQCAIYGKSLEDAVGVALEVWRVEDEKRESPFMGELLSVWLDDKITGLKKLRPKSIKSIRNMANMFKADFGTLRIKQIDGGTIETYLKGKEVSDQTRLNLCRYLQQFFNWAMDKGFTATNPADKIKKQIHVQRGTPEFFTVEQCECLLKVARTEDHKALLPYIVLGLFAGIRPEECERMNWENIKIETKEIYLPASITKTKKDRLFTMSENLFQWLSTHKDIAPLVPPTNIQNMRVRLCKAAGVEWIADGLRHTFSTFHYAKEKNLETLRSIMGNSPGVIERFYKGTISSPEVEKYWDLVP